MHTRIRWSVFALAMAATMAWQPAVAVEPPDLYTAEVGYDAQRRNARQLAYERALAVVLQRMTTEPQAAMASVDKAGDYVLGWRESGRESLWVSFDGVALGAHLQAAGIPVWGSDRPLTLVWLGIEHADGSREILSMNPLPENEDPLPNARERREQLREMLRAAASQSGLPVSLPVMDETDAAAVAVSDVWGGFDNVLRTASRRYRADSLLVGRVSIDNVGSARWQWTFGGQAQSFRGAPAVALGRVAAQMREQFAARPEESAEVRVSVVGIRGAGDYAELLRFLETRSLVDNVRVTGMRQDEITFTLDALASRDRLQDLLAGEELEALPLQYEAQGPEAGTDLLFRWRLGSDRR